MMVVALTISAALIATDPAQPAVASTEQKVAVSLQASAAAPGSIGFEVVEYYDNGILLRQPSRGLNRATCRYFVLAVFDEDEAFYQDTQFGRLAFVMASRPNQPARAQRAYAEIPGLSYQFGRDERFPENGQLPAISAPPGKLFYVWYGFQTDFDEVIENSPNAGDCHALSVLQASGRSPSNARNLLGLFSRPTPVVASLATVERNVELGEQIPVTLSLRNTGAVPLESLALLGGVGLNFNGEYLELVSGPDPAPPGRIEPGATLTFQYVVQPLRTGRLQIDAGFDGTINNAAASDDASVVLNVPPDIDVVLSSSVTSETRVGDEFTVVATLTNNDPEDVGGIRAQPLAQVPGDRVTPVSGPLDAVGDDIRTVPLTIASGETETITWRYLAEEPGVVELTAQISGRDPREDSLFFLSESLTVPIESVLALELVGVERPTPDVIELLATLKNSSDEEMALVWGGGLRLEVLAGTGPIGLNSGPSPVLPATIAPEAEIEVRWRYDVRSVGAVVATLDVGGTTLSGASADAVEELSVQITDRDVAAADMQRAAVSGVNEYLGTLSDLNEIFDQEAAEQVKSATEQLRDDQFRSYQSMGFSDANAERLAGMAVNRIAADAYWESFKSSASTRVRELGGEFVDGTIQFAGFISDPERLNATASHLVDSLVTNAGYLADSFAIPVGEKVTNIWDSWTSAAGSTSTALGQAWDGQRDLWRIDDELWRTDRVGLARNAGGRHGRQAADFGAVVVTEVVSQVATAGAGTALRAVRAGVGKGVSSLRATVGLAGEGGSLARAGGDDALGAATREFARVETVAKRFQDLEFGAVIDVDEVARLAGFSPGDSAAIDALIIEVKVKFGVDIKIIGRTAEPDSVGIANGKGKQSFTSEKAVGELDRLMGAPESLSGRVSIFEPIPLDVDVADAMEAANPGFTARFAERFKTQQKNWDAYVGGTSKTRRLVEASERHSEKFKGITVVSDLPGNSPLGLEYLEQLYEPDFRKVNNLTEEAAAELYTRLSTHPSATRTNLRLDDVDGAKTLVDIVDDTPRPIVSDLDLQAVLAEGGFPMGRRGEIEMYVKRGMDKLGRSGRHGWSTSAFDLPSEHFDKAAEFILRTAHPSVARQTAKNLYNRFQALASEFRDRAALELSADRRRKLLAAAERLEEETPDTLLAKWPPGEKTIVYTAGRITVGSGTGGTP